LLVQVCINYSGVDRDKNDTGIDIETKGAEGARACSCVIVHPDVPVHLLGIGEGKKSEENRDAVSPAEGDGENGINDTPDYPRAGA
jgi:hypothetical protein